MKRLIPCLLLIPLLLLSCSKQEPATTQQPSPQLVLRYAENQPLEYPTTQAALWFAEQVNQRTDGRISIIVYPDAKLGDEKSVFEQMEFGAIDFARGSLSPLSELAPSLNILQLPYLYRDAQHMWNVLDGAIGDQFLRSLEPKGIIGLSWYDAGSRNFYTSGHSITTLQDMQHLKIRVQESQLMSAMIIALGATPVQMPYGNVYASLQTGEVDGAENNWPSYEATRHYEVAKYFVTDGHNRVPEMQIVSAMTWDSLSQEDRDIIAQCAKESSAIERKLWAEKVQTAREHVLSKGVVVTELAPGEREKFEEAVRPLYTTFGSGYQDIIQQIQATP
ncbi:MAG: TRAP transporter substrate-binding protein [Sphaerochaeta sp.]|jgi:tripartite ATP-independent transporter DctP family solute receptor|nr:TRAP transporter substrate-binding protein [Sphaerochaeta sp.]